MIQFKKQIALFLSMLMILTSAMPAFATKVSIKDIEGHWAKEMIQSAIESGLITGYADGTFKPDNTISRAEFFTLVNRGYNFTKTVANQYADVSETAWYAKEIEKATAAGYIDVEVGGMLEPTRAITREEAAHIIAKVEGLYASSLDQKFTDSEMAYAGNQNAIIAVNEAKIMNGYPTGEFKPKGNITRAEAIVTLSKSMAYETKENFVYNEAKIYGDNASQTTVDGNVVVTKSGATLKNLVIKGDLTISSQVAEGTVVLQDVEVEGATIINGGGVNSIYFNDAKLNAVYVDKALRAVRLVATGDTVIEDVVARTKVELQEKNLLGQAVGFRNVLVEKNIKGSTNTGVTLLAGVVSSVDIKGEDINLILTNSARVTNLKIEGAKTKVLGNGLVMSAVVNAELASFSKKPVKMEVATGVKAPAIKTATSTSSSSGSSSGGGGGSSSHSSSGGSSSTPIYINTPSALANAIENASNKTVTLQANIAGNVVANRSAYGALTINFNGYSVNGDLNITADNASTITLNGTNTAKITGNIILDAINASVSNNVAVDGKAVVKNVAYHSYKANKNHGKGIDVTGHGKIEISSAVTHAVVNIKSDSPVVLSGIVDELNVESSRASAIVEGTINKVNIRKGAKSTKLQVAPNAKVKNLKADEGVTVLAENATTLDINIDTTGEASGQVVEKNAYRVTFDENGGDTLPAPSFVYVESGKALGILPSALVRNGYVFKGWNTTVDGSGDAVSETTTVSAKATYYAQWEKKQVGTYTLTFESNGGTFVTPISGIVANSKITLPSNPERKGYLFAGWYTDNLYKVQVTDGYTVSKDMKIYAKWFKPEFNVYFESNEGTAVADQVVDLGQVVNLSIEPTREGYKFAGWYTDYNLTEVFVDSTKVVSDMTLYAKWIAISDKTFTVTFMNGTEKLAIVTVPENAKVVEPSIPAKEGYEFAGWYTDAEMTKAFEKNQPVTSNLTLYAKYVSDTPPVTMLTVTFMDGTKELSKQPVLKGDQIIKYEPEGNEDRYFNSWYKDAALKIPFTYDEVITNDLTLYAKYIYYKKYTVTYNANGGSVDPSSTQVKSGTSVDVLPVATKDGYTFEGWFKSDGTAFTKDTDVFEDIEVTAKWTEDTPPVTMLTVTFMDGTKELSKQSVLKGDQIIKYEPEGNEDRYFNSWYKDAALKIPFTYDEVITNDLTLYAKYIYYKKYTVTYNANGGSVDPSSTQVKSGASVDVLPVATKDGYTFEGWFKSDGTAFTKDTDVFEDIEVTAKWTEDTPPVTEYTVTYNANGGSVDPLSTQVTSGAAVGVLPVPTKTGYTFEGWFKTDGSELTATTQITENIEVTAKWTEDTPPATEYTVTYNANGGSVDPLSTQVTSGAAVGVLPVPTKTGYTFEGWFKTDGSELTATTQITENIEVTAKWTEDTPPATEYTVTYNANGGSVDPSSTQVTSGAAVGVLPVPNRPSYEFKGWFKTDACLDKFTASTVVNEDIQVNACWTTPGATYTVTFMDSTTTAATKVVTSGGTVVLPLTPTQSGKTFAGWYVKDYPMLDIKLDEHSLIYADVVVEARWH